jgi:hypothetical protein
VFNAEAMKNCFAAVSLPTETFALNKLPGRTLLGLTGNKPAVSRCQKIVMGQTSFRAKTQQRKRLAEHWGNYQ